MIKITTIFYLNEALQNKYSLKNFPDAEIYAYTEEYGTIYMPYVIERKFDSIKNAYKFAFKNLDKKVPGFGIFKFVDNKLLNFLEYDEFEDDDDNENNDPAFYYEDHSECDIIPNDADHVLDNKIISNHYLLDVIPDYEKIFSKDMIFGVNILQKLNASFELSYTNYNTVLEKSAREYNRIALWGINLNDGCFSRICFMTLKKVDNIIDNNIVEI
jgi:hypothetical protein